MDLEENGKALLDDIRASELKPYNVREVNKIENGLAQVEKEIEKIKERAKISVDEKLSMNYVVYKAYKERCRRILDAYKMHRLRRIYESYLQRKEINSLLSMPEVHLKTECYRILDEYLEPYLHLDLYDREPPLNLYVQVMVLEDCGMVMVGKDFVELKRGRLYYLNKKDISHLLNNEVIKIIK